MAQLFPIPEERFRLCADRYLVHLAALLGPVASLDDVGGWYRVHGANSYEPQSAVVSVANVRNSIGYAAEVSVELERIADRLGLARSPGPILSVADIANLAGGDAHDAGAGPEPVGAPPLEALQQAFRGAATPAC